MLVQQLAGGAVSWSQLPVYLLAELAAGVAAGLVYLAISRTAAERIPVTGPAGSTPATSDAVTA
jgi:glycerol uptake facilitator protein